MTTTTVSRTIAAPIETVFDSVADIRNYSQIVPEIVDVEFLSETQVGVGTRFRETRQMGKRKAATELEVTEYIPGERVRIVSDVGGTVWDTTFHVAEKEPGLVDLTMVMDARAHMLLAKIFNPLIRGMVRKAIEKDLDAVKAHCER